MIGYVKIVGPTSLTLLTCPVSKSWIGISLLACKGHKQDILHIKQTLAISLRSLNIGLG